MDSYNSIRNWLDLRGLPVNIPSEGRSVGTVDDFYYKVGTNAIYALRIKSGLSGFEALAASAISTIERNAVTVASQEMLIDESNGGDLTELPLGNNLLGYSVLSESGTLLGTIENILLATYPPVALRIAAFKLAGGKTFSAKEVTNYGRGELYILDKVAKRL
ncbi:MAG TPA: PRC-barrel domain-containing protein [Ktedonobacteraceae bacterium]